MRAYESAVQELDQLLATAHAMGRAVNLLSGKLQVKRWLIGRVCFEIFGNRPATQTGLTVAEFAKERGCTAPTIRVPLRVYRVLGDWYERQIEPVKFTIAKLTAQHTRDVSEGESLMEVWRKMGEPDEAKWKSYLARDANKCDTTSAEDQDKQRRLSPRARARRYVRKLKAARRELAFGPSELDEDLRTEVWNALRPHVGKRSTFYNFYKHNGLSAPKVDAAANTATRTEAERPTEPTHAAPAAELLAACVE